MAQPDSSDDEEGAREDEVREQEELLIAAAANLGGGTSTDLVVCSEWQPPPRRTPRGRAAVRRSDGTVAAAQFLGRAGHRAGAGNGLEGAQGGQRWQLSHGNQFVRKADAWAEKLHCPASP